MKKDYYFTEEGLKLRSKWCQFLNNPEILDLKHGDKYKYEVKATLDNLIRFFKTFFPKLNIDKTK